jgi:hypothetical protein
MCLSLVLYHSVSKADSYHTPTVDIVLIRLGIQNILTNFIYWKANVRAHEVLAIVTLRLIVSVYVMACGMTIASITFQRIFTIIWKYVLLYKDKMKNFWRAPSKCDSSSLYWYSSFRDDFPLYIGQIEIRIAHCGHVFPV